MKRLFSILVAVFVAITSTTVFAAPTCVMMKFANDTRYKNIDSASLLSNLVLEKLLASGKFNLQETMPVDEDIETRLYDEKSRDILDATASVTSSNFNMLFENGSFDVNHAQSIATARVGQIISPEITASIGRNHGAEYLIQGTIINMGNDIDDADVINNSIIYVRQKESGIGVVADVKLIKASTGEVIWRKSSTGTKKNSLTQIGIFKLGSAKLNSEMYNTAMENCAQEIIDGLLEDLDAGKLFVK